MLAFPRFEGVHAGSSSIVLTPVITERKYLSLSEVGVANGVTEVHWQTSEVGPALAVWFNVDA